MDYWRADGRQILPAWIDQHRIPALTKPVGSLPPEDVSPAFVPALTPAGQAALAAAPDPDLARKATARCYCSASSARCAAANWWHCGSKMSPSSLATSGSASCGVKPTRRGRGLRSHADAMWKPIRACVRGLAGGRPSNSRAAVSKISTGNGVTDRLRQVAVRTQASSGRRLPNGRTVIDYGFFSRGKRRRWRSRGLGGGLAKAAVSARAPADGLIEYGPYARWGGDG